MNTVTPETRAECDECGKSFPSRELKYNEYFDLLLCPVCNRKLAAFQDIRRVRIYIEIIFWAWVGTLAFEVLVLLTILILTQVR
jgi:uncharacterized protein YbaR (Trm112 family)